MAIYNPVLLADKPDILAGLTDGSLERSGSVVRDLNGRIRAHLPEVPDALSNFQTPMPPNLGPLLQLTQIGAMASVLNVGISAVGFAYMGYKLNKMQKAMTQGFENIENKLDDMNEQLRYAVLLAEANQEDLQLLKGSLQELHRLELIIQMADLAAWLEQLGRFPDENPREAIRVAAKTRRIMMDQALRAPAFDLQTMVIADVSIRGWAVATSTEAQLLLQTGNARDAYQLIDEEGAAFDALGERWANQLLDNDRPQLQTAYRFAVPELNEHILAERVNRIAELRPADRQLTDGERYEAITAAKVEYQMSYQKARGQDWLQKECAAAEYLDGISELTARLRGVGALAREVDHRQLKSSQDLLPGKDAQPGIYCIPAIEAV